MIDAGGSGAGAALGGAIAGRASGQAPSSVLAAKVDGANQKAGGLGGNQKKLCPTCPCPPETMKANVIGCDGGAGVWNKATAALGKEPNIMIGDASGYNGVKTDDGVRLKPNSSCCEATQYAIIELTNVGNQNRFDSLDRDAAAGEVGREDYARYKEQIEYDGVLNSANAFDSCKTSWGCSENAQALYQSAQNSGSFDNYYDQLSNSSHTNLYRQQWDQNYQSAYEGKHLQQ